MKKNVLALSIATAFAAVAGSAVAAPTVKANGVGTYNVIPYFSTQGSNVTQLAITNTDMVNGKVVKVRFRGAEWSDDIFDFTVFLSPGDVFTGAVSNNGNNVSKFETSDGSCTLPTVVNQDFPTIRLHNTATGSLEGYIEILTMANIPPGGTAAAATYSAGGYTLYSATKHVNGVAPCKTAGKAQVATTALKEDNFANPLTMVDATTGQESTWMAAPTTGLTSWARVLNTSSVKAYGVPATAIDFGGTNKAYFKQSNDALVPTAALTSDRIFFAVDPALATVAPTPTSAATAGAKITTMYQFDMPDLSTDIEGAANAITFRDAMTAVLAKSAVATEYSTLASVSGATDVVLTQPTRRYYYNYKAFVPGVGVTATEGTNFSRTVGGSTKYYVVQGDYTVFDATSPYEGLDLTNRVGLADLVAGIAKPVGYVATPAIFFDREEQFQAAATNIVISPTPPVAGYTLSLKGEASVVSFNRGSSATETGALGGKLTMNDISIVGGYSTGWMILSTVDKTRVQQLPVIGFSAQNVAGANNYGTTLPLRYFGAAGSITQ